MISFFEGTERIFPNYLSHTRDVNLVSKVSGDFNTDIYQPVEYETFKHEAYVEHFKRQTIFVAIAVGFVLLVLNTMLFFSSTYMGDASDRCINSNLLNSMFGSIGCRYEYSDKVLS